jgi:hypothetical protein
MRVKILTAGFSSPNGRAFLMPLLLHRRALADLGLELQIMAPPVEAAGDCDVLIVDGRVYSPRWRKESAEVLDELASLRERVKHLVYVSIADSAGWDHARALPLVSLYCKSQLLRDRTAYTRPLYGNRIFSDYYHRQFGVSDAVPMYSEPVADPQLLNKLTVSWNSGLADYSWLGPYRMKAYQYLPSTMLLRFPDVFHPTDASRAKEFSCRIGTSYQRESVAYQRRRMAEILARRIGTAKLSRRAYLKELQQSRVAISPFGLGEITLRDFEIFINGALLLKPSMAAIETWPDFFQDGVTMAAHRWDLSDLEEVIEAMISQPAHARDIAAEGQRVYRKHLIGPTAGELFAEHFRRLLAKCDRLDR